jgi:hypothetical protein
MKKLNLIIAGIGLCFIFIFSFCASGSGENEESADTSIVQLEEKMNNIESTDTSGLKSKNAASQLGKEYTSKYICPDHCKGSGSDKEGKCSVCGMDLMENPNYGKNK